MSQCSFPDIELLPCPFCGGGANLYQNEVDFHRKWSIGCGDCYADMDVCEDGRQEAAEIWNTRASQTATPTAMAQSSAGTGGVHPVEKLWRECDLPEWFLGNGGSNAKLYALYDRIRHDAQTASHPADALVGQIEERFPNWRSYRDLVDCIDCTLHALRASPLPSSSMSSPDRGGK